MLTVLELSCPLFLEAQIGFVHQGGALQGVARTFLLQIMMRGKTDGSSSQLESQSE